MSTTTFERVVEEEVRRLEVIHLTSEDIPGCMRLLDEFLSCHGTSRCSTSLSMKLLTRFNCSSWIAIEVAVQAWRPICLRTEDGGFQVLHEFESYGAGRQASSMDSTTGGVVGRPTFGKEQRRCVGCTEVRLRCFVDVLKGS